jgi:hypothetical protein
MCPSGCCNFRACRRHSSKSNTQCQAAAFRGCPAISMGPTAYKQQVLFELYIGVDQAESARSRHDRLTWRIPTPIPHLQAHTHSFNFMLAWGSVVAAPHLLLLADQPVICQHQQRLCRRAWRQEQWVQHMYRVAGQQQQQQQGPQCMRGACRFAPSCTSELEV